MRRGRLSNTKSRNVHNFAPSRNFGEVRIASTPRRMVAEPPRVPAGVALDALTPGVVDSFEAPKQPPPIVREGSARDGALARARAAKLAAELSDNNFLRVRRHSKDDLDEGLSTDISPKTPLQSEVMMNSDVLRRQMDWLNDSATKATKAEETQLVEALVELTQTAPVKKKRLSPEKSAKEEQQREEMRKQIVAQLSDTRQAIASLEREAKQLSARRAEAKERAASAKERVASAKERAAAAKARADAARASMTATKGRPTAERRPAAPMKSSATRTAARTETAATGLELVLKATAPPDKGLARFEQTAQQQATQLRQEEQEQERAYLAQQASSALSPQRVVEEALPPSPKLPGSHASMPEVVPWPPPLPPLPRPSPVMSARRGWRAALAMCIAILAMLVSGGHLAWTTGSTSVSSIRPATRGLALAQRLRATCSAFRVVQLRPDQSAKPRHGGRRQKHR